MIVHPMFATIDLKFEDAIVFHEYECGEQESIRQLFAAVKFLLQYLLLQCPEVDCIHIFKIKFQSLNVVECCECCVNFILFALVCLLGR